MNEPLELEVDGESLTIREVVQVARFGKKVRLAPAAIERMNASRAYVDDLVQSGGAAVYGINTGLGFFSNKRISTEDAARLSRNLVLSHAVGVGEPFPEEVVRAAMLIRANTLAVGHSGVRPVVVETLIRMLNAEVYPLIPDQGSLGSSGDLAPLSHLALVFTVDGDETGGQAFLGGRVVSAREAMQSAGVDRILLSAKEGLALSNGTSFSAALAALAVADGENIVRHAEYATALVFEALLGVTSALDDRLHRARRHRGQMEVAKRLREFLKGSTLVDSDARVQDAYSLRCAPQILGPVCETVEFAARWVEDELNAVTDNPLIFREGDRAWRAISGGNFHGEVLAFAADFLGIALAEVGALAERQINRLLLGEAYYGLPTMLVNRPEDAGLNSGLMMPHYTAASLVLENQTLAHPDSVHSLPTSAGQEDVNANSHTAAKHLRSIIENVENILAILLFTAVQAIDLRVERTPGVRLSPSSERIHGRIREISPKVEEDRYYHPDVSKILALLKKRELTVEDSNASPAT